MTDVPIGRIRYDSAQMSLSSPVLGGLAMTVAYTISKNLEQLSTLNPQDVDLANPLNTKIRKAPVISQSDITPRLSRSSALTIFRQAKADTSARG